MPSVIRKGKYVEDERGNRYLVLDQPREADERVLVEAVATKEVYQAPRDQIHRIVMEGDRV